MGDSMRVRKPYVASEGVLTRCVLIAHPRSTTPLDWYGCFAGDVSSPRGAAAPPGRRGARPPEGELSPAALPMAVALRCAPSPSRPSSMAAARRWSHPPVSPPPRRHSRRHHRPYHSRRRHCPHHSAAVAATLPGTPPRCSARGAPRAPDGPGREEAGGGEARPRPKLAPRTPVLPPVSVDGRLHPHHRVGECAGRADHHHQQRLDRHPRGHGLGGGRSTPLARHATPSQLPELRNPLSSPPSPTLACTGPSLGALGRPRHRLWPLLHHRPPQMAQGGGVGPAVLPPPTPPTPDPRRRRHPRRAGDPRPLPVPPLPSAEPPPRRAHLHRHGRQACRGKGARHRWGWGG